jgi:hypothetical protein
MRDVRDVPIASLMRQPLDDGKPHLDPDRVAWYVDHLDEAQPVTIFDTGDELILADGYHRADAAARLGRTTIRADVRRGSRSDALHFALAIGRAQRGVNEPEALSAIKKRSGARWAGGS